MKNKIEENRFNIIGLSLFSMFLWIVILFLLFRTEIKNKELQDKIIQIENKINMIEK